MITILFITLIIITLAFLFTTIWGKQSKEEPKDKIVWEKFDEHERKLSD